VWIRRAWTSSALASALEQVQGLVGASGVVEQEVLRVERIGENVR